MLHRNRFKELAQPFGCSVSLFRGFGFTAWIVLAQNALATSVLAASLGMVEKIPESMMTPDSKMLMQGAMMAREGSRDGDAELGDRFGRFLNSFMDSATRKAEPEATERETVKKRSPPRREEADRLSEDEELLAKRRALQQRRAYAPPPYDPWGMRYGGSVMHGTEYGYPGEVGPYGEPGGYLSDEGYGYAGPPYERWGGRPPPYGPYGPGGGPLRYGGGYPPDEAFAPHGYPGGYGPGPWGGEPWGSRDW